MPFIAFCGASDDRLDHRGHLALLLPTRPGPAWNDPERPHTGGDSPHTLAERAGSALRTARLPCSLQPREMFTALAGALLAMGYRCLVEINEIGHCPYRINRPHPDQEAAAWAELTMLLEVEPLTVSNHKVVGVRFQGDPPARFIGALTARLLGDGQLTGRDVQLITELTDHAVDILHLERLRVELSAQRGRAENLQQALASNREIGVAIGIIMATRRCTADDSFATLISASQNTNRKVRQIAATVALTGELPPVPPAGNLRPRPSTPAEAEPAHQPARAHPRRIPGVPEPPASVAAALSPTIDTVPAPANAPQPDQAGQSGQVGRPARACPGNRPA